MGVASSRPGWGVEENIENWEGVYLDTEDRVVALDVDGDPENRQAVLIGESFFEACCCWALARRYRSRHAPCTPCIYVLAFISFFLRSFIFDVCALYCTVQI